MDDDPSASEPIADGQFNLVLCVVSSAVAGIGIGLFGCLLSAADHMKRRNSGVHTSIGRTFQICGICGSIVFGLASLVGLIFGSVSLATVVRAGSTLPSNAIFSQLLGLRPLVRDDVLGTLVTISGIVSFTIFQGWAFYQHSREECLLRISSPGSLIWLCFLVISQAVSVGWLCLHSCPPRDRSEDAASARRRAVATTMICSCSSAFMDLAAKGWSSFKVHGDLGNLRGMSLGFSSPVFWVALSLNVIFLVILRWGTIYGCRKCDVLIFVPLNTTANIIISVASGMICLAEYTSVKSWPGLVAAGLSMLTGIFMLVTGPADTGSVGSQAASFSDGTETKSRDATPMSSQGEAEHSEVSSCTDPVTPAKLRTSASSAHSFVYLNRIHRRAARTRSAIVATHGRGDRTPERSPVTDV